MKFLVKRIFAGILLAFVFFLIYLLVFKPKEVAAWFDDRWHFRKAIVFDNTGSAVTNQKVKLDINTATAVDPETANFNTTDMTFTPNMAKRNAGTGSSAPFAAGVMVQGKWDGTSLDGTDDSVSLSPGSQVKGSFYQNYDKQQGTIVFWVTPEWNGNDNKRHFFFTAVGYKVMSIYKDTDNYLYLNNGWNMEVKTDVSNWVAGTTYLVTGRWSRTNTLDGTNYMSISVGNSHTFSSTSSTTGGNISSSMYIGIDPNTTWSTNNPADALIEGLTIYRRPLFDGTYGINVGNGDEIEQIFNSGAGQDPTLITGSWDVVFALPTNASTGSLGVGGTGSAWSHPHSSNVLYTSTTNTGGFMMAGTASTDNWISIGAGGTEPTIAALATNEKIFAGGYKVTSDDITANQGIGTSKPGLTAGQNYVVRALANSDGTSIPKVQIWDNTNNAEITSLTGTIGSGRTAPDSLIFTFELPTVARYGVASDCTNMEVRLLNTESSGTVYWHQVEVQTNLLDNPSMEIGSTAGGLWIPSGWNNVSCSAGTLEQDISSMHSGISSWKAVLTTGYVTGYASLSVENTDGVFYGHGRWAKSSEWAMDRRAWYILNDFYKQYTLSTTVYDLPNSSSWKHYSGVVRGGSGSSGVTWMPRMYTVTWHNLDDIYLYSLTPVSLTVTPASLANSTESTGIRVDGADTATATISNLTTTNGTIKFIYTPRHSGSDSNKFVQSGTTTDDIYLGEWYGDSDDYIKLYWDSNASMMLKYSMAGVGGSGSWNGSSIAVGTTYPVVIDYTGGSTMSLSVGDTTPVVLSSIPASFGTAPSTAYWGTNSSSTGQADATYAQVPVTTGVKMQSDCDDVRFTDVNGNLLEYYYDAANGACNAESTDFYVLMPTIAAGDNTIYMYYGNPTAEAGTAASNFSQDTFSQDSTTLASEEQGKAPIAYWSMDEGQGSTIYDSSSSMNNGTLGTGESAPAWQSEDMCQVGKCLLFDGGDDYISIGNAASDVKSVSFWVKPITTSESVLDLDGGSHYILVSSGMVSATGFDSPTIYVNGKVNGTVTANQWTHIEVVTSTAFDATNITLGQESTNFLNGFLDEVKLYSYTRTAAEAKTDYNAGKNKAKSDKGITAGLGGAKNQGEFLSNGLVGYWKMDENTGITTVDSSGNSNTSNLGTGDSAPAWAVGKFGSGLNFDGSNDYSFTSNTITLDTSYTISVWIKADSVSSTTDIITLTNGSGHGFIMEIINGTLRYLHRYPLGASGGDSLLTSTSVVSADNWTHIVMTRESVSKKMSIYVNNALITSQIGTNADFESALTVYFGFIGKTSEFIRHFDGTLDEVRIYNRALSPAEVSKLYEWAPGPVAYYKFDEGSGSSAFDSSGYGNSGTLGTGNSAPTWATGKYGKGLKFDGSFTEDIQLSSSTGEDTRLQQTNHLNFGASTSLGVWQSPYGWLFRFILSDIPVKAIVKAATLYLTTSDNNTSGTRTIYAARIAAANGDWIEGTKNGSTAGSGEPSAACKAGDGAGACSENWAGAVGCSVSGVDYLTPTMGSFVWDDGTLANTVLSVSLDSSQVQEWIGQETNNGFRLWPSSTMYLNGGFYSSETGTSTNRPKLTLEYAFSDNYNNYVNTANKSIIGGNDSVYNNISWGGWVKPVYGADSKTIIYKDNEFKLTTDSNSKANCSIYSTSWQTAAISSSALSLNTWSYVTCTYDGENIKVYINGLMVGNTAQSNSITSTNTTGLNIGRNSDNSEFFNGLVDDVKIYNYARTQKQIVEDMNAGHPAVGSPVGSNLVYLKMDEGYGSTANNSGSSGTTNNATLATGTSAPSWSQNGKFGKALSFDGTSDYLTVGGTAANTQSVTFWVNPNGITNNKIMSLGTSLNIGATGSSISSNGFGTPTYYVNGKTTSSLTTNIWQHVAIVGSTNPNATTITIGKNGSSFFTGLIDEVKFYNYGLTKEEIKLDYNQGQAVQLGSLNSSGVGNTSPFGSASQEYCVPGDTTSCAPPVARWDFNEGVGSSAYDSSGNNYFGSIVGPSWTKGKIGKALNFDGIDDYVEIPDSLLSASSGSISIWFKTGSSFSGEPTERFAFGSGSSGNTRFYIGHDASGNCYSRIGSSSDFCTYQFQVNTWYHVELVWPNSSTADIYIDGIFQKRVTGITINNSLSLIIGRYADGLNSRWLGSIDQIKLFNYARTPAQIAWDYNRGVPAAYYKFDECQGSTLNNSSANTNSGIITIGGSGDQDSLGTCTDEDTTNAWYNGRNGKYGGSLNFDGSDDYVNIGVGTSNVGSVSVWVKPTATTSNILQLNSSASITSSNGTISATGFTSPTIYVNGKVSTTLTADTWQMVTVVTDTSISANAIKLGLVGSSYYAGQMDEVRIYNYPLNATLVKTIYNEGGVVRFGE